MEASGEGGGDGTESNAHDLDRPSRGAHFEAEGWYHDPYRRHQDRWYSVGRPTRLVRDGGVESYDEPPEDDYSGPLTEAVEPGANPSGPLDLRRADGPLRAGHEDKTNFLAAEDGSFGFALPPKPLGSMT